MQIKGYPRKNNSSCLINSSDLRKRESVRAGMKNYTKYWEIWQKITKNNFSL